MVQRATTDVSRRPVPSGRRELRAEGEKLLWLMFGQVAAGEPSGRTVRRVAVEAGRRRAQAARVGAARKTR